MRIIGGSYGGRRFDSPRNGTTHPMSERARGALFNILGDLEGLHVLDAFSGSGALAFESISRGAEHVVALENNKSTYKTLQKNLDSLAIPGISSHFISALTWCSTHQDQVFDIILCDPPYDNMQLSTITCLVDHLKPKQLMVISHTGRGSAPIVNGIVVVEQKRYGDAALAFYRKLP